MGCIDAIFGMVCLKMEEIIFLGLVIQGNLWGPRVKQFVNGDTYHAGNVSCSRWDTRMFVTSRDTLTIIKETLKALKLNYLS